MKTWRFGSMIHDGRLMAYRDEPNQAIEFAAVKILLDGNAWFFPTELKALAFQKLFEANISVDPEKHAIPPTIRTWANGDVEKIF